MTIAPDTIATFVPPTAPLSKFYAHRGPHSLRKFLYERDEQAITIQLSPPPDTATRVALDSAVERINALHRGFSASNCPQNDLVPAGRAAVTAIWFLNEIAPRIPAQIFPLPGGGLQLEWHHGQLDIEIECLADGSTSIYSAIGSDKIIDESASGPRAKELLGFVREHLAEAASDYSGGSSTILG